MDSDREWTFPDLGTPDGYPPPGTLTSTAITGWMTCARCWAHDNLQHLTKPASVHFAVGTAVHHAAEIAGFMVLNEYEMNHADTLVILDQAMEVFNREVSKESDRNGTERVPPTDAEAGAAKDVARRIVEFTAPRMYALYRQRGLVALEYQLPSHLNPFPFPMTGRCDAISGGPKKNLPLILSDIKTASALRRPDQNNRLQGGTYALFIAKSDITPMVIFDTITKSARPAMESYKLGPEGAPYMTPSQLMVVHETVVDVACAISDGYAAFRQGDWGAFRANFPIGQGWNGKHDYDHGIPEAHLAA